MDKKRLVTVMLVSAAIVLAWSMLNQYLQRTHPEWYKQPEPQATQQTPATPPSTQPGAVAAAPATAPAGGMRVVGAAAPATVHLGHAKFDPKATAPFPMGIMLTSQGAAVQSVTLNRFSREVGKDEPYVFQRPYAVGSPALRHAFATQTVTINGVSANLAEANWTLRQSSDTSATFSVNVTAGDNAPGFVISKHYEVQPAKNPSLGYEVLVRYDVQNQTGAPASVKLAFNGPTTPDLEALREVVEVVAGHNDDKYVVLTHNPASGYAPEKGAQSLRDPKHPMLWAGTTSAYFDAIVLPEIKDGKAAQLADVKVQALAPATGEGRAFLAITFETADLSVAPGQSVVVPLDVYFGPRWRDVLNTAHYQAFPRSYDKTLVLTGGLCGFCTFQWLINVLVWMLSAFHVFMRDWGLAIIGLVLVVRLILHPITKKSQVQMSKMSKMGPEIERLKKKHGDNKEELNKAMMQFYKEQGATPILGCLPMMLQMPIWIALWSALQSTFELRHAPFLYGLTWIHDLAQPDRLIQFRAFSVPLMGTVDGLNLLPLLLAVVFYAQAKWQQKIQPKAMDPQQEQQQKMMMWMMTLLFPLMLYSGPSGLNLYILTSTGIGIWESKRVRDHIKEQEEREKLDRVIIDVKPTRASKKRRGEQGEEQPQPRGCLGGWFSNMQQKVRDIQDQAEKRYGKGK